MVSADQEKRRLAALHRYAILDSPEEDFFDELTALCAEIADAEHSCITLVDERRSWFKSTFKLNVREVPREPGFCASAIYQDEPLYIPQANLNPIARDNSLSTSGAIRFYIGIPLRTPDGYGIGTLCAFDPGPKELREEQIGCLTRLGSIAMHEIDRRWRQHELERTEQALRQTQRLHSIGMVAGGVAHDFNNLLGGILGNAALLRQELDDPPIANELLNEIEVIAQRAADLAGQVLAYVGNEQRDVPEPLDLNSVVRETAYMLEAAVGRRSRVELDLTAEAVAIRADRSEVQQLIMNLITNAAESYGPQPGAVHLRTRGDDPQSVLIEVTDQGAGIEAETVERIFDPFFSTKPSGKGLGLAVVQRIVSGLEGTVAADSVPGKGTTFQIRLPRSSIQPSVPVHPPTDTSVPPGEGTILVVDDENLILKLANRILSGAGYEVLLAPSGADALELYGHHRDKVTAIVLDLSMPDMNGAATLRALRDQGSLRAPVILSSGHTEEEARSRMADDGVIAYLKKPYTPDGLIHAVRAAVSAHA